MSVRVEVVFLMKPVWMSQKLVTVMERKMTRKTRTSKIKMARTKMKKPARKRTATKPKEEENFHVEKYVESF